MTQRGHVIMVYLFILKIGLCLLTFEIRFAGLLFIAVFQQKKKKKDLKNKSKCGFS